jgi:hypothetical protein
MLAAFSEVRFFADKCWRPCRSPDSLPTNVGSLFRSPDSLPTNVGSLFRSPDSLPTNVGGLAEVRILCRQIFSALPKFGKAADICFASGGTQDSVISAYLSCYFSWGLNKNKDGRPSLY